MKKLAKVDILEFIETVEGQPFTVIQIGVYRLNGEESLFVLYQGQGLDRVVYEGAYDELYDFTGTYQSYLNGEFNKEELAEIIYDMLD